MKRLDEDDTEEGFEEKAAERKKKWEKSGSLD